MNADSFRLWIILTVCGWAVGFVVIGIWENLSVEARAEMLELAWTFARVTLPALAVVMAYKVTRFLRTVWPSRPRPRRENVDA